MALLMPAVWAGTEAQVDALVAMQVGRVPPPAWRGAVGVRPGGGVDNGFLGMGRGRYLSRLWDGGGGGGGDGLGGREGSEVQWQR